MNYREFNPCTLLNPVPAVMVSCKGTEEGSNPNIITIAWAGTVNTTPPMVSISIRKERYSHHLISESGEFVVNLVDQDHCQALDFCGVKSGSTTNKFEAYSLEACQVPEMNYAPAIKGLPAYLACKVRQIIPLGSHDLFIGEVVAVRVRDDLFDPDGSLHLERCGLVCYNHGVYQKASDVLGFFGYSIAKKNVRNVRMQKYKEGKKQKR